MNVKITEDNENIISRQNLSFNINVKTEINKFAANYLDYEIIVVRPLRFEIMTARRKLSNNKQYFELIL